MVWDLWFRIYGLGFRIYGLGFMVWDVCFRAYALELMAFFQGFEFKDLIQTRWRDEGIAEAGIITSIILRSIW